jgi:hypothetical protein
LILNLVFTVISIYKDLTFDCIFVLLIFLLIAVVGLSGCVGALKDKIVHVKGSSFSKKRQPLLYLIFLVMYFILYFMASSISFLGAFR